MSQKLRIYQIGLYGIGRYGFEHLVELTRHFSKIDVELAGVYDRDFDRLERAEKFAEVNGIDIDTFQSLDELYRKAEREDEKVMVYDAGTSKSRPENIHRSIEKGFFHLAEKPPSMTRQQHIQEKKLAKNHGVMWKVDFIERESPVVKRTFEILEGEGIEEIKVFRESSTGIEKVIDPETRINVRGGDILDKMINEVYVLDFIEASKSIENAESIELELEGASTDYFLPSDIGSESLMSVEGSRTRDIENASTAQTQARFSSGETSVKLSSSWMGLTEECMLEAKKVGEKTGHRVYERSFSELNDNAYMREDARFFVVEGERRLVGDLLNSRLFDLETGEEIETKTYMHDQLYRVLENAVKTAAGKTDQKSIEKETDVFMNALFDVKKEVSNGSVLKESSKGSKKLKSLVVSDKKVIKPEGVAR